MTIPYRGRTSETTYFITADCWEKKRLLQSERMALLLIDVFYHYRSQKKYVLHEFVVMPHHFHLLITPLGSTLERTMQLIKGGFSFRAGKEFSMKAPRFGRLVFTIGACGIRANTVSFSDTYIPIR